jgi:serine/threonine protein kinase
MTKKEEMGYQRELEILKKTDHPFIIEYIEEFALEEKNLCIVTRLAPGGDLD